MYLILAEKWPGIIPDFGWNPKIYIRQNAFDVQSSITSQVPKGVRYNEGNCSRVPGNIEWFKM